MVNSSYISSVLISKLNNLYIKLRKLQRNSKDKSSTNKNITPACKLFTLQRKYFGFVAETFFFFLHFILSIFFYLGPISVHLPDSLALSVLTSPRLLGPQNGLAIFIVHGRALRAPPVCGAQNLSALKSYKKKKGKKTMLGVYLLLVLRFDDGQS